MDAKREQFVRLMGEALKLLRQARNASSLSPQKSLFDQMSALVADAERLAADDDGWIFGRDREGRVMNESGQVIDG